MPIPDQPQAFDAAGYVRNSIGIGLFLTLMANRNTQIPRFLPHSPRRALHRPGNAFYRGLAS
jgi:hypothetical protein